MNIRARRCSSLIAIAATVLLSGCGRDVAYRDVEIGELRRVNAELEAKLAAKDTAHVRSILQNSDGESATTTAQRAVGDDAIVSDRARELVISVESGVLFRPGSAELSTNAKSTLNRVAALVKEQYPNHYVRVEGHTDNAKISQSKAKWTDNWDLAGGRAQVVLHYLMKAGIDAGDLGFAGYADQRPVTANSSESGKQKNRRVEIVVIPR
jgi:chemotaxis protein MotB